MNRGGEPGICEQPPIPVRGQGGLSPVHDPRLGSRRCNRHLGHGRGDESRFGDVAAPLLSSGGFLVKRREVLQKTRAEQFGLGRVPPMIKSGVGSTEKRSPHADMVSDYLYLRRRVGRTWATSLLQYLVGHQLPIVGGVAHWSTATPTLTRRLLPAARGYCSSVDCRACPDTSLVASCRGSGRGLAWHVGSATPPVDGGGDSWSAIGPSEDTPRSGWAEDVGSTWLSRDVAEMWMLCCSPRWT
ncbi:hypothetical protein BHM03_00061777 [Ensete ventricosum]|nr:hypothetical protein BHM03_00061777 [Ensete ventricosum]